MAFLFVISLFLLTLYILLIGYYHSRFNKVKKYNAGNRKGITKVTVIIPARNEENNIATCLQSVLQQNYPNDLYEIIVVDDFSKDNTASIVNQLQQKTLLTHTIQLLSLHTLVDEKVTNSFKKKGIELAIQKASGELIICTDADCKVPPNWLSTIVSFYESTDAQFIVMPVRLVSSHQQSDKEMSFVEIFQTLDFITLQGITAASVDNEWHTMCNGANLAYTKKAFQAVHGFAGIDAVASGDDMLLMYKIQKAFPGQIRYLKSTSVLVDSLTVNTWKQFFHQRIRWASKASHYEDKKMFYVLLLVYCVNVVCFFVLVSLVFNPSNWLWILIFLSIKFFVEFRFVKEVVRFFQQKKLLKWFALSFPVHIFYTISAGFLGKFGKYKWKDRVVK
jgi:cellulose synthase/poly-beta-1,6-N-acetylglucosamine synthase-like glycosyltransferase